jgi:hypothetical protein
MAKNQALKRPLARSGAVHSFKAKPDLLSGSGKRRGVRVNSQVPVAVEWRDEGEIRRGEAQTRVVGPYGCLVVLRQILAVDQQIQVTNLVSRQASPAVIVWRGHERAEGWELGIELINPRMDFWGLDL